MIEILRILEKFDKISKDETFCLAEVVKVNGSAYRQPGAKMLISSGGSFCGTVSGGCLEGDALKQAKISISQNINIIKNYDTQDDSINKISRNLGCNGLIDILFQPIKQNSLLLKNINESYKNKTYLTIATIINTNSRIELGTRFFLDSNHTFSTDAVDEKYTEIFKTKLAKSINSKSNFYETIIIDNEEIEVFFEIIPPQLKLFIFGSGFDVKPIIKFAKELGWFITVTSDSYSITIPEDFAGADIIEYADRSEISDYFNIDIDSFCILISHNYKYDIQVLNHLLKTQTQYIGILGPKKRFQMMKEELIQSGLTGEEFNKIYSPIGLDIGGENPEELALSIISEILAVKRNRNAGFLKLKPGKIHD